MWSSTGNFPPTGLLDGQFSDIGSYRGCIDLNIPYKDNNSSQVIIKYTSYCTIPFRAIVPSRQAFHPITNEGNQQLADIFNRNDVFNFLANKSQYFNYVYMKSGICVPSDCSAEDIQLATNLVAKRLLIMPGPVECFTRALRSNFDNQFSENKLSNNNQTSNRDDGDEYNFGKIENKPILVELNKPMNSKQFISIIIIGTFYSLVFLSTIWHSINIVVLNISKCQRNCRNEDDSSDFGRDEQLTNFKSNNHEKIANSEVIEYGKFKHVSFGYLSLITNWLDFINVSSKSTEIKSLHGLRAITMIWIIIVHSLQYNNWSGFIRIFENTKTIKNIIIQPIYNANYSVDNFFFMSGLLTVYTCWYSNKGTSLNFSFSTSLLGRYLRLTPQVLLVSLLYITLPLFGDGPFWFDVTNQASKYCEKNWWINLLHLQSFYRKDEMCNLVGWWISVDMFLYILALAIIYMILTNRKKLALLITTIIVTVSLVISSTKHFNGKFTPNNLANVPQVAEVWTKFVIDFFWSPFPHAFPFFLGLWTGFILANNMWSNLIVKWSKFGWTLATISLIIVNLSSHIWISGKVKPDNQYISTAYNTLCPIIWALAYAWFIMACHYGSAPTLNNLLSSKLVVLISKASFIIYLSHMLVVRSYFGLQNSLLEVSILNLVYTIAGNIILSIIFGIFLHVSFEGPCMKFQKFIMGKLKSKPSIPSGAPFVSTLVVQSINQDDYHKASVKQGLTSKSLLKS